MEEADVTLYAEQRPAGDISQVSQDSESDLYSSQSLAPFCFTRVSCADPFSRSSLPLDSNSFLKEFNLGGKSVQIWTPVPFSFDIELKID